MKYRIMKTFSGQFYVQWKFLFFWFDWGPYDPIFDTLEEAQDFIDEYETEDIVVKEL